MVIKDTHLVDAADLVPDDLAHQTQIVLHKLLLISAQLHEAALPSCSIGYFRCCFCFLCSRSFLLSAMTSLQ